MGVKRAPPNWKSVLLIFALTVATSVAGVIVSVLIFTLFGSVGHTDESEGIAAFVAMLLALILCIGLFVTLEYSAPAISCSWWEPISSSTFFSIFCCSHLRHRC